MDDQRAQWHEVGPDTTHCASLIPPCLMILYNDKAHRHGVYGKDRSNGRDVQHQLDWLRQGKRPYEVQCASSTKEHPRKPEVKVSVEGGIARRTPHVRPTGDSPGSPSRKGCAAVRTHLDKLRHRHLTPKVELQRLPACGQAVGRICSASCGLVGH